MKEIKNECNFRHQQNYSNTNTSSSFQGLIPKPPAPMYFALANWINHTAPWKFYPLPNNLVTQPMDSPKKPQLEAKPGLEPGFEYSIFVELGLEYSISVEPSSDPKGEL